MQTFAEYLQPITVWLTNNPHWALLITFLISFSESLAIIGSIVPGTVTMTAIGILAGSGVMRIDLTILAAIAGAIIGDSASYFLGYYFSNRIMNIWPFKNHPMWLEYGNKYFKQHGGKSVLLGRFAGPLRSIIPLVAGMMKMRQDRFLLANVLSAIGWSILYVMPGVLIGAASSELSNETATKLFIGVLLALLAIWLIGLALKWLIIHSKRWLDTNLHRSWMFAKRHPNFQSAFLWITPPSEKDHAPTSFLIINILILLIILTILITLRSSHFLNALDQGIYYFFSSIRNIPFDDFFIITALFSSFYVTIFFYIIISIGIIIHRQWRALRYWLCTPILNIVIILLSCKNISQPLLYPVFNLNSCFQQSWLTTLCCSLLLFANYGYRLLHSGLVTLLFFVIVGFSGLTNIYFAQLSLTDTLISSLNGVLIALILWLFYRRKPLPANTYIKAWVWIYSVLLISFAISFSFIQFPILKDKHPLNHRIVTLTKDQWLNQTGFEPPVIRRNRWGTPVSFINIQFIGKYSELSAQLQSNGWNAINDDLFQAFIARLNDSDTWYHHLPFLPQIYSSKLPSMVLVKQINGDIFVLRLWQSYIRISPHNSQVYFGSVHQSYIEQKRHNFSKLSPIHILEKDLPHSYKIKPYSITQNPIPVLVDMPRKGLLIQARP